MLAKDLKPGDLFTVDPPDYEGSVRVCLDNKQEPGEPPGLIKWGFPDKPQFHSYMGHMCEVELVKSQGDS